MLDVYAWHCLFDADKKVHLLSELYKVEQKKGRRNRVLKEAQNPVAAPNRSSKILAVLRQVAAHPGGEFHSPVAGGDVSHFAVVVLVVEPRVAVGPVGRVRHRGRRQRHLPHPGGERVTSARQVEHPSASLTMVG